MDNSCFDDPFFECADNVLENDENLETLEKSDEFCVENVNYDSVDTEEINSNSNSNSKKQIRIWTNNECTKRLVELYTELMPKVGRSSQFTKKKHVYNYISKKLYNEFGEKYTGTQVGSRMKNIYRRKIFKQPQLNSIDNPISEIDISKYNLESMYDNDDKDDNDGDLYSDDYDKDISTSSKTTFTNEQTKKIIRLYNMFLPNVGSNRQFKTKKDIWEAISEEILFEFGVKYTTEQLYNRYKTILKKAKRILLRRKLKSDVRKKDMLKNLQNKYKRDAKDFKIENNDTNNGTKHLKTENKKQSLCQTDETSQDESYYNLPTKSNNENVNLFENKFENIFLKQYIEFNEQKQKIYQDRHNEIIEHLNEIHKTLQEIKTSRK